eukprot:scaffold1830_cov117-Cylindrotheca_fusiformis.AAC.7
MSEKLQQIVAMGYSKTEAQQALTVAEGDLEQAVGFLLLSDSKRGGFESIADDAKPAAKPRSTQNDRFFADIPEGEGYLPEPSVGNIYATTTGRTVSEMSMPSFSSGDGAARFSGTNDKINELVGMGYSIDEACQALKVSDGDIHQAIGFLLLGNSTKNAFLYDVSDSFSIGQDSNDAKLAAALYLQQEEERLRLQDEEDKNKRTIPMQSSGGNNVPKMVLTTESVSELGSAPFCTCVAARKFLDGGMVNAEYLNSILKEGLELFRTTNDDTTYNIEKVLQNYGGTESLGLIAPNVKLGVFKPENLQDERGLRHLLLGIRNEQTTGWEVVILDVGGSSFCITLPPKGTANKFWIIDFMARSEFNTNGAYARVHNSLLQLEESLEYVISIQGRRAGKETQNFNLFVVAKNGVHARELLL